MNSPLADQKQGRERCLSRAEFMRSNDDATDKTILVWVQGNTLVCKQPKLQYQKHVPPERILKSDMSDKSRFNLLKIIHSIDWEVKRKCLFVTLSYPEHGYFKDCREAGMHRSQFWRSIEEHHGRHVPAFWRIEWEDRKSGRNLGMLWPHFHLLIVGVRYIPYTLVQDKWASIHHVEHIHTYIDECKNREHAAEYAAKYAAKCSPGSLASAPNHNTRPTGRQWGILRKKLLPVEPCRGYVVHDARLIKELADNVPSVHEYASQFGNSTFTLLGPRAVEVERLLRQKGLDGIPLRV